MPGCTALTIGTFDGVHCGHRALIRQARLAAGEGGRVIGMVFDPHPLAILKPETAPAPLSTLGQRRRWLLESGMDEVIHLATTPDLLATSPEEFVSELAVRFRPRFMVEGPDFRFGRDRRGDIHLLRRLGNQHGFETIVLDPVEAPISDHSLHRASSTLIRWLVARGRMRDAALLLGRPFEIETTVIRGAQRGRDLGFPTTNLAPNGCLLPADGIYAGHAELPDGRLAPAAISVGDNPTFQGQSRQCEAHLLDHAGPLDAYGWTIRLRVESWVRDQIRFDSMTSLKSQIKRDVERIRTLVNLETIAA